MNKPVDPKYRPETNYLGRSLSNYIALHPSSKGCKTLTEARKKAFGEKKKNTSCRCRQSNCTRLKGNKSDSC